jgi:hypothetical protein
LFKKSIEKSNNNKKGNTKKHSTSKIKKQIIEIVHSLYLKEKCIYYRNKLWKATLIAPDVLAA